MKAISTLVALLFLFVFACNAAPVSSDRPALVAEHNRVSGELAEAKAEGDAPKVAMLEAELANIENQILRERAGPIVSGLGSIFPPLAWLSPFVMGLVPLLGKRGRQHYGKAILSALPGTKKDSGSRMPDLIGVAEGLLKGLGPMHSEATIRRPKPQPTPPATT